MAHVLRDERYTGKLISGKMKKMEYGDVKTKLLPKSEWLVVPDAHEPIISQEVFDKVQTMLGPYHARTSARENSNLFAGKIFCGHCKHGLRRYGERKDRPNSAFKPRYVCKFSTEMKLERCLPKIILESQVKEVVLDALKVEFALADKTKQQAEKNRHSLMGWREKLTAEAKNLSVEIERLKNTREQFFEDYVDGKLSKEQYLSAKSELSDGITQAEASIESITAKLSCKNEPARQINNYDLLKSYADATEVTAEMMCLVKRVNVFADNRFEIEFAFSR